MELIKIPVQTMQYDGTLKGAQDVDDWVSLYGWYAEANGNSLEIGWDGSVINVKPGQWVTMVTHSGDESVEIFTVFDKNPLP